jgi:hypothetical protein
MAYIEFIVKQAILFSLSHLIHYNLAITSLAMESNKFLSIGFNSTSDILSNTLERGLWKKNSMSVCGLRKRDSDVTHLRRKILCSLFQSASRVENLLSISFYLEQYETTAFWFFTKACNFRLIIRSPCTLLFGYFNYVTAAADLKFALNFFHF